MHRHDGVGAVARVLAVAATLALMTAACNGGDDGADKVVLESVKTAGPDPFTTEVEHTPSPPTSTPVTLPPVTAATAEQVRRVSGVAPGLYGGTQDKASCDVEQMVEFLSSHAAEGKAWASAAGVNVDDLPEYLRSLTAVVLRADTRVINHGFKGGKATPREAVLQAGTAVLVDERGVPRAKCACGNPLLPPENPQANVDYTGDPWPGFEPEEVTAVTAGEPVDEFTLVDTASGETFTRPVGGTGATDEPASAGGETGARGEDKVYEGTGGGTIDVSFDVPFVVTSTHDITGGGVSGYFVQTGDTLQPAGRYPGLVIEVNANEAWRVVVRPLGPKLHSFSGTGDKVLGSPRVPDQVVVDFKAVRGTPSGGDFYLGSDGGVLSGFTALRGSDVKGLEVADHQNNGWTLDIWGVPPGCGYDLGTDKSVKCS